MKSEWISALSKSLADSADKVPAGWKTARQIADEMEKSVGYTQRIIQSLLKSGSAETKAFKLFSNSVVRSIPHYRILSGRKPKTQP